jgi:hypothetical protein
MSSMKKISYNTRIDQDLIKRFKILAIKQGVRQNELLEEAMWDILKKYKPKSSPKKKASD